MFKPEHFVDRMIKSAIAVSYPTPPRHEFRTSSLPYCPIQDLQSIIVDAPGEEGYDLNFYCHIGTAVHENLQNMCGMGELGRYVFGSWKCPICGKEYNMCFRPRKCECGHKLLNYVEVAYNYKGLSGHQDMMACYPCDSKGNFLKLPPDKARTFCRELQKDYNSSKYRHKWCGFEYKTTGTGYLFNKWQMKYLPYSKHYGQIEAYCVMAKLLYNINFDEYSIIYVSRECPKKKDTYYFKAFVFPWTKEMYDFRLATIERACTGRKYVEKYAKTKDDKYLKKILKYRPCKCRKDWEVYMKKGYFGNEECPYLSLCCSNSLKPSKIIKDCE